MRAAIYDQFGGADVLTVREVPDPPMAPDAVLVSVKASGVNPVDWKVRQGHLQGFYPHHLPIVPGWDVAGVVEAVGPAVVTGIEVGDEVFGYVRRDDIALGTAAELVAAPERTLALKPAALSFAEAAGMPLAGLTAYQCLVEALQVQPGERVLVHAASGGVGHLAVQIAKARGAYVIGTASPAGHDRLRELGAHEVLDYSDELISKQLEAGGGRVHAVLDLVGGEALEDAPQQVHDPARIASIVDNATVLAMGGRFVWCRAEREHLNALADLVDTRHLRVSVADTFTLDQIADAHRLSETGHPQGKVVVTL